MLYMNLTSAYTQIYSWCLYQVWYLYYTWYLYQVYKYLTCISIKCKSAYVTCITWYTYHSWYKDVYNLIYVSQLILISSVIRISSYTRHIRRFTLDTYTRQIYTLESPTCCRCLKVESKLWLFDWFIHHLIRILVCVCVCPPVWVMSPVWRV